MRRAAIAMTAAIGGTLLVPATPLADQPPTPPTAVIETASTTVTAGTPVRLDSGGSRAGTGAIVGHVWDLDGNGSFETDTGSAPTVETTPTKAGPLTVHVRVVDDRGQSGDAKLDLAVNAPPRMTAAGATTVAAAPASGTTTDGPAPAKDPAPPVRATASGPGGVPAADPGSHGADTGGGAAPAQPATSPTTPAPPVSIVRMSAAPALMPRPALSRSTSKAKTQPIALVTAAAASGVTIKNFQFSPGTSSVHVGDTITWTNKDQAAHTATAKDGSFDTGTINQNKTGSHTFTKAGTFPYICSIHPSMKGTVAVLAAASSGSGGSGGTGTGSTTKTSSKSSGLPHTGLDIAAVVLLAALMMGSGTLLRRRLDRA